MEQLKLLKVTHANTNEPLFIDVNQVFAWWNSAHHRATMIMASGGGMIPVKESTDIVTTAIEKEKTDVR